MTRPGPHHPLPGSDEARHGEIPETIEAGKGRGDDPEPPIQPRGDPVNPDGEPYSNGDPDQGSES